MTLPLPRRVAAEAMGTALLALVVVGSGIMGQQLHPGNDGAALLANSLATGFGLYALILTFGALSGAHFNPVVTLAGALTRAQPWREVPAYVGAQASGAVAGVALAHALFAQPLLQASAHVRAGAPLLLSEAVGTALLLLVILRTRVRAPQQTPAAVAAVVAGGYWFTASTFFTNPALTLGRAFTATFAGIRAADVGPFVAAQGAGLGLALLLHRYWSDDAP